MEAVAATFKLVVLGEGEYIGVYLFIFIVI